jgi:hypothetical protein
MTQFSCPAADFQLFDHGPAGKTGFDPPPASSRRLHSPALVQALDQGLVQAGIGGRLEKQYLDDSALLVALNLEIKQPACPGLRPRAIP